jgi:hypothetical protein
LFVIERERAGARARARARERDECIDNQHVTESWWVNALWRFE